MSKTKHNYAWLKQFCGEMSKITLPFKVKVPGYKDEWFAATNGKRAVVLRQMEGVPTPQDEWGEGPPLDRLLAKERIGLRMESRQAIMDLFPAPDRIECPQCRGRGKWACSTCDGDGKKWIECDDCGHEHQCKCDECENGITTCEECDGEKTVWKESIETWTKLVLDMMINGQLLVPILASFEDRDVSISRVMVSERSAPTWALMVCGASWTVLVCERDVPHDSAKT